jgi:hypothetical protein
MRSFLILLLGAAVCLGATAPNILTPKEVADGWILLFDGETTFGWTSEGHAKWRVASGALVADSGESGWLRSNSVFADFMLRLEFRTKANGNSGIFLRSAREGRPHETGYELQIWDGHEKFPTGSLVNIARARPVKLKPDFWHVYEIFALGNNILIKLDGRKVLEVRDSWSRIGHIGLQYNKDNRIEFRNLRLRPLGLVPLFNSKNLNGWQEVKAPSAKESPVWAVRKGVLHVERGPGQLESKNVYEDFVLQLDVRTNTIDPNRHPNSGVFFRGAPGGYWSGYESQIRNEFRNGDRTRAVDFGTGGIYRYQEARKVVPDDNQFFTKTIVARGRQISVWVNGWPVSSWEDTRPEALLKAGPISLQAHDPATNLDFRDIRIQSLARAEQRAK